LVVALSWGTILSVESERAEPECIESADEAETLETTDDMIERSTVVTSNQHIIHRDAHRMQLSKDGVSRFTPSKGHSDSTYSCQAKSPALDVGRPSYRNQPNAGISDCVIIEHIGSSSPNLQDRLS
jgi:hypothetical protein